MAIFFIFRFTKVERHENPPLSSRHVASILSIPRVESPLSTRIIPCPFDDLLRDNLTPLLVNPPKRVYLTIVNNIVFFLLLIHVHENLYVDKSPFAFN